MQLGGLRPPDVCQNIGAERINTEKPPYPRSLEWKNLPLRKTFPLTSFLRGRGNGVGWMHWVGKCAGWRNSFNQSVYQ